MIQFNLLPDVKIEYIKTRRRKRLIIFISIVTSSATFAVFVLLFLLVRVQQSLHLKNLDSDIKQNVSKIQETKDLDKILTIQNQLNTLPGLYDKRVFSSRLTDYLNQLTPAQATISNVDADFEAGTINIKGNADALSTVNKYADTLKFTEYSITGDPALGGAKQGTAFKDVVLSNFSVTLDERTKKQTITYGVSFKFDPQIFTVVKNSNLNGGNPVQLKVPQIISTRSETEKPADLFAPQPAAPTQEGQR